VAVVVPPAQTAAGDGRPQAALRRNPVGRVEAQRDPGRLHGLANDRQQLGGDGVKIDLVAQPGAEGVDRPDGVVLRRLNRRSTTAGMRWRAG
jgi:hypothetical protein